ncbi:hypothetical protein G5C51_08035 [Streptomyces sp. A7024]|uniref:Uncharacterized protein n=1 Tax=Streptomyces coryli TaxID=1128680 RepID=A0A6G4TXT6_9ACTN|nr:hypothetical protein [Streptomyces coryli]NGN63857.1 hypothetical protein [Streptomyces coryli]
MEILKIGTQRPRRIKVRFAAEEAEGEEAWVPPASLRVPWGQHDAWLAGQRRWDELTSDGPVHGDAEFEAASWVFDQCTSLEGVASMGWNYRERGVLYVADLPALAAMIDVSDEFFARDPRAFRGNDGTVADVPGSCAAACASARRRVRR